MEDWKIGKNTFHSSNLPSNKPIACWNRNLKKDFMMKTLRVNRKCYTTILITLMIVFFGAQGTSYAQTGNPTITASALQPLTEATLNDSVVILTLSRGIYAHWTVVTHSVKVSGIPGVTSSWFFVRRLDDTRVQVTLKYDGTDFNTDTTLTFTVEAEAVTNYVGPPLTATILVPATHAENPTITASSVFPLVETTLDRSVVTLTLSGSTYTKHEVFIENALTVSGIEGGTLETYDVDRISDTEVEVELTFEGNIDTDTKLTFTVGADAIANYEGPPLTATIPVIAVAESLTALTPVPLTEMTLDRSIVTLTLSGGISYESAEKIGKVLTVSGIAGVTLFDPLSIANSVATNIINDPSGIDNPFGVTDDINSSDYIYGVNRVSNTEVKVRLLYDGTNIDTDAKLSFTLGADAIVNYDGSPLFAEITVSPISESIEASSMFPLRKDTLDGNLISLTLSGAAYKWFVFGGEDVRVSGITGVTILEIFGVRHINDTEITVELEFDGDLNIDGMLTFTVDKGLIANYNGPPLNAKISVSSSTEAQVLIPESQRPGMYWASTKARTIRSLRGMTVVPFVKGGLRVTSLAIDEVGGKLYWTERTGDSSGTVKRVNLDGTKVELLAILPNVPLGIAIDSVKNKLYWTNSDIAIQSANLNGENIRTVIQLEDEIIVTTKTSCSPRAGISFLGGLFDIGVGGRCKTKTTSINLTSPTDIAVDPIGNKLYWIELSGRIRSVNLDGTSFNTFATDLGTPGGIAVADGKLYWTAKNGGNRGRIESADLNGTNFETLTLLRGVPAGISVDTEDDKVYWANANGGIQRIDINGGEIENVAYVTAPKDFALVTGTQQTVPATEATTDATVSISPSSVVSPAIGQQIDFGLSMVRGEAVAGYQASVQFDTTALRYVSGANGDFLPVGAFFVQPVVAGNLVKLNAASLAGESNGGGTLATLTFEVIAVKASTLTLSDVLLTNSAGEGFVPQIENTQITEPTGLKGDVNGDGIVNIQDLVLVAGRLGQSGANSADVNGDGVVNIQDLVLVAGALGNAAAAPSLHPQALEMLSAADVRQWLAQAQQLDLTDATSLRGILFLEQLLAALLPKATVLLPNYPNPFNPETWIPYRLAEDAFVMLTIYDGSGQVVRTLDVGHRVAAVYESRAKAIHWDGRNEFGEGVASGVYFYHLSAGRSGLSVPHLSDYSATRKMLIIK